MTSMRANRLFIPALFALIGVALAPGQTSAPTAPRKASAIKLDGLIPEDAGKAPDSIPGAETRVYKTASGSELKIHIFHPPDQKKGERRPAILFFFGGGWRVGSPRQFEGQCRYLAGRGMVAATADYRIKGRQGTGPMACVADAKSAVRWMRAHADELGIDPKRLAAGGGSAGGHIAACAGVIQGLEEPGEDTTVSSVPDLLALFNPALDVSKLPPAYGFGDQAGAASPNLHIRAGLPPTIIFHGRDDQLVPFSQPEAFTEAMKKAGNRCELMGFDGEGHGFFNFRGADPPPVGHPYNRTLRALDEFLVSLGWLAGEPTIPKAAP